jgi:MarR family 2-MHQ and catechol resistance regulon transcriptional repressor
MTHNEVDADVDALLVHNLLRTEAALSPHVDRGLRDLNLTGAQFNALLVLRDARPDGLPLSEVGRRLVVTKANVTGLIDRLERQGLVQRDPGASPEDRRITHARLTEKGMALLEEALPRRRQVLAQTFAGLTPEEKTQLIGLLTRLRRALREAGRADADAKREG